MLKQNSNRTLLAFGVERVGIILRESEDIGDRGGLGFDDGGTRRTESLRELDEG